MTEDDFEKTSLKTWYLNSMEKLMKPVEAPWEGRGVRRGGTLSLLSYWNLTQSWMQLRVRPDRLVTPDLSWTHVDRLDFP